MDNIKQIIKDKVDGVWETAHDGSGHRYRNTKTGHLQRSVTTKIGGVISKPHLTKWAVKKGIEWLIIDKKYRNLENEHYHEELITGAQLAHTDNRDDAGNVGTVAHNAAERFLNEWLDTGVIPEKAMVEYAISNPDPRSVASIRAVEKFFRDPKNEIIPVASEILVGDIRYSAGALDLLAMMNGKLTLIDFKTSNAVDQISYSMQVSAYKYFFEGMTGLKIAQCKILHLSKDYDKFEIWKLTKIPLAWKMFKNTCQIYDWMYGVKDKIIRDIKRISI
jgi:hypothetical protein